MFCVYTEIQLNKTTPNFQVLPMSKVTSPNYAFMRRRLYSKRKDKEYQYIMRPLRDACWVFFISFFYVVF